MPAYGRLLHDFCEKLGIEGATLVGNSMGGFIAVEAATAKPGPVRAARAGLGGGDPQHLEPGGAGRPRPPGPGSSSARTWLGDGREIVSRPRARELVFRPFFRYPGRLREDLLLEQIEGGLTQADGFDDALQALIRHDIRERLAEIEMPTLIVWGLSDRVIPVAAAISYHRRIPHSRLEIFERTGHVPQLERPLRFNALLDEFLAE